MARGLAGQYSYLVHEKAGWWGTFPVLQRLRVGDYVQMGRDGKIKYLGTIMDWPGWAEGLPVEPFPYEGRERFWAHATADRGGGGSLGAKGAGLGGSAEASVNFTEEAGFVLNLAETAATRFRAVDKARQWILAAAKAGQWDKKAVLITEVISAARTTVLIAEQGGTSFSLKADASIPVDISAMNLVDPSLHLDFAVTSGSGYSTVQTKTTPLYHCARIRRTWYGRLFGQLQSTEDINVGEVFETDPFGEGADEDGDGDV